MLKNKFIMLLKSFSKTELRLFELFLKSPYYNVNEDLILLFKEINKYAPNFINKKLERQTVFKNAFKNQKYNEKLLGYYTSDLTRLAEKFCTIRQIELDESYTISQGLNSFLNRKLDTPFKRYLKTAEKTNDNHKFKNAKFYYNQYILEKIKHDSFALQNKRTNNQLIYNAIESLDTFYISEKLRFSCQILNRKNVFAVDYEDILIKEIINQIESKQKFEAPSIEVYFYIYKGMVEPEEASHFHKLKQFIDTRINLFEEVEATNIYLYAINYAVRQVNSGNVNFENELFLLYKNAIVQRKIFTNKFLSPWTFKNMVTISLRVNEFDWVETFIEEYLPFLEPQHKANAYIFNKSKLLYAKKQYDQAQIELSQVAFTDIYYHLDSKILLAKIYFDKNESTALNAHLENLRIYVRRHKLISEAIKGYYSKWVGYIKKAYHLNIKDKNAVDQLKAELHEQANISDRKWLISKIDEKLSSKT